MGRIAPDLEDRIITAVREFGFAVATARKLVASSFMPIILNGEEDLTYRHLALLNQSVINHIIGTERAKECPFGTDFLGVQHKSTHQDPKNPSIRSATMYPNGKFIIHCQSKEQSRLMFKAYERVMNSKSMYILTEHVVLELSLVYLAILIPDLHTIA